MHEMLFGPLATQLFGSEGPLLTYGKQYPLQMLVAVLVVAQFAILALHMMFGAKGSSRGGDGGDIGGWDFGDADGGDCGD